MIVAVTGLRAEAAIARAAGLQAVCGGGDERQTVAAIRSAIGEGARGLVSFGIAGGLAPDLDTGDVVLADCLVTESGERFVPPAASSGLGALRRGVVLGSARIIASAAEKRSLHAGTGALTVDLESHLVARAAERAGLPWAVLRAVADPASRALPPAALVGLKPDGSPDLAAVLLSLCRAPAQLPALLAVARDSRAALAALRRLGPALADRFFAAG
jgi:adenosylhomocysteine nucleosidase